MVRDIKSQNKTWIFNIRSASIPSSDVQFGLTNHPDHGLLESGSIYNGLVDIDKLCRYGFGGKQLSNFSPILHTDRQTDKHTGMYFVNNLFLSS